MKRIFKVGDVKRHQHRVVNSDLAKFESGLVHPVCSTFALAREMEWSSRLFVIEMTEDDEEGIGTALTIKHASPALEGELLELMAIISSFEKNELICEIIVNVGARLIANGETSQKILKSTKIAALFSEAKNNG